MMSMLNKYFFLIWHSYLEGQEESEVDVGPHRRKDYSLFLAVTSLRLSKL